MLNGLRVNGSFPIRRRMSKRVFVTDWDETATVKDTTAILASAMSRTGRRNGVPPFSYFSKLYLDAYGAYKSRVADGVGCRNTLESEEKFQMGMRDVELTSIRALEESGFFRGVPMQTFLDLAPAIELQPGFISFLKEVQCPAYILSVNWCRRLIEEVLRAHGVDHVTVLANDFEVGDDSETTGKFDPDMNIRTGFDKAKEIAKLRRKYSGSEVFYFGDSSGDVLPILEADFGGYIVGGKAGVILHGLADIYALKGEFKPSNSADRKAFEASWHDIADAWARQEDYTMKCGVLV